MINRQERGRRPRTGLAAGLAVALLAGCSMRPTPHQLPPTPDDVRAAKADVEQAFASAASDPPSFVKLAKKAVPRLREALQRWSTSAEGSETRLMLRGWALEAGQIETKLQELPPGADAAACAPIRASWSSLRAMLP